MKINCENKTVYAIELTDSPESNNSFEYPLYDEFKAILEATESSFVGLGNRGYGQYKAFFENKWGDKWTFTYIVDALSYVHYERWVSYEEFEPHTVYITHILNSRGEF